MIFLPAFFLFFISSWAQLPVTQIDFDHIYRNETTPGNHRQKLYELHSTNDTRPFAIRVVLVSRGVTHDNKLMLEVNRGPAELQAQLPRTQIYDLVTKDYWFLAETVCEKRILNGSPLTEFNDTVSVAVKSRVPAFFNLEVIKVHGFKLEFHPKQIALSPSEPLFFLFTFSEGVDQIAIRVTALDDVCGRVTVLKAGCPVFENGGQVATYSTYKHQTITRKGYLIIPRDMFGDDIHIVITVLPIDEPCLSRDRTNVILNNPFRVKNVTVEIKPFEPSRFGIWATGISLCALAGVATAISILCCQNQNKDEDDSPYDGTNLFWIFSLVKIFVVVPLAIIIVSLRETDSYSSKDDDDTCNFNFECAIPVRWFVAGNNMVSAFSIVVVAIINFIYSKYMKLWRRLFGLNSWILLTGVFWTLMNICPQEHTYFLYSMAMIMTVVEAKLLLFEKRNGRNSEHYIVIGFLTMIMMILNIVDVIFKSLYLRGAMFVVKILIELAYIFYFSYAHGLFRRISDNIEWKLRHDHEEQNRNGGKHLDPPKTPDPAADTQFTATQFSPSTISGEALLSTSTTSTDETSNEDVQLELEEEGNILSTDTEPMIPINSQNTEGNASEELRKTTILKRVCVSLSLINVAIWAISIIWLNSTVAMLRFIQLDFLIYFGVYILNGIEPKNNFIFWSLLILNFLCIVLWGFISAFLLPAFVPYSPAESRTLNTSCFDVFAMDWHDILHFVTASIYFFFPLMIISMEVSMRERDPPRTI